MDILEDERFIPLRELETLSDDMFNRIISFQERNHPAWNEDLPFDERIKGLPLHNLIFSNPDRDPATMGPTVANYYPLRDELRTIVHCAKQVAKDPVIADLHPGNGFIGSLIAREGVTVIGLRDPAAKQNQIKNFYDTDFYQMLEKKYDDIDFSIDVAFSSWMPSGINITPQILKCKPKLIVYIYTDHEDNEGTRQTGAADAYTGLPENYQLIAEWDITRPENLLHEVWPDLTPNPEEIRYTRIYADKPYQDIDIKSIQPATNYDWEVELQLALLAIEAKAQLRAQGKKID